MTDTARVSATGGAGELSAIRWNVDERVATVWLHRPHRHNAWTGRMHAEYRAVMAAAGRDRSVRAAERVKGDETTSYADWMSASRLGSLIHATWGSSGGVGGRWRNRAGLAS